MKKSARKKYYYLRDQQRCFYCHKSLSLRQVTLDHYLPKSHGGTDDPFNLVCCCKRCNQMKASKVPADVATIHQTLKNLLALVLVALLTLVSMFQNTLEASPATLLSLNNPYTYSAEDLAIVAYKLAAKYPDWVSVDVYGESEDSRPLILLKLGDQASIKDPRRPAFLVEAGMHAREVINPVVLLSLVEAHLIDIHDPDHLPHIDSQSLLASNTFYIMPLTNPDGFNLAKFGLDSIQSLEIKKNFPSQTIKKPPGAQGYWYLKANARGVDLNRNFPDVFYKALTNQWVDIWNVIKNQYHSSRASSAFYPGPKAKSEKETQALTAFIATTHIDATVSLHSRGEVIYGRYWMYDAIFNALNEDFARAIAAFTKYEFVQTSSYESASGYLGDYLVNTTYQPVITLETTTIATPYNTSNPQVYKNLTARLMPLFATMAKWQSQEPPDAYWRIHKGKRVGGFSDLKMANAYAKRYGGSIWPVETPHPEWITWQQLLAGIKPHVKTVQDWPEVPHDLEAYVTLFDASAYFESLVRTNEAGGLLSKLNWESLELDAASRDGFFLSKYSQILLIKGLNHLGD